MPHPQHLFLGHLSTSHCSPLSSGQPNYMEAFRVGQGVETLLLAPEACTLLLKDIPSVDEVEVTSRENIKEMIKLQIARMLFSCKWS